MGEIQAKVTDLSDFNPSKREYASTTAHNLKRLVEEAGSVEGAADLLGLSASGLKGMIEADRCRISYDLAAQHVMENGGKREKAEPEVLTVRPRDEEQGAWLKGLLKDLKVKFTVV